MKFTYRESRILEEIANTFISPVNGKASHDDFWLSKGAELLNTDKIAKIVSCQPRPAREEFMQLLKILDSPLLGITWGGPMGRFLELSATQREKLLRSWSQSRVNKLRKAFSTLKKLCTFLYYSSSADSHHPAFEAIGYPGPFTDPGEKIRKIGLLEIEKETLLRCEILIIGSGAGGSVVANELADAGKDVVLVEKGPYLEGDEFTQEEGEMFSKLYEGMGAMTSSNGEIHLLAGSCLGGGTTINWSGCFHTPDYVLDEWATDHSVPFFREKVFQNSLKKVASEISASAKSPFHNFQNRMLWEGSETLKQVVKPVPRNESKMSDEDLKKLGFSCLGDKYGKKQGALKTFLSHAAEKGARIISDCHIEKIVIKSGRATGAEAIYTSASGEKIKVFVQVDKVVLAAGAIHTPAILKRSGVPHPHIGRNLYLHPTVGVTGIYREKSEPWYGPMMSAVNDHFTQLSGNYGFKLETPPTHPGVIAMSLPWSNPASFKEDLIKSSHFASFIAITRDKDPGYITVDKKGAPVIHYQMSKHDLRHALAGMAEASRIHFVNDCQTILYPHYSNRRFENTGKRADLEKFLHDLPVWGWKANQYALYSAHQMATCRMGGDNRTHPTSPDGHLHGIPNLYIADASAFPSASGVNPMLTIMALAHYISQGLK